MSPPHFSGTACALYRIFVAPTLRLRPPQTSTNASLPWTAIRPKFYKRDTERHALSDAFTLDNAISAPYINLIGLDGLFQPKVALANVSYDRVRNHLVLLNPGRADKSGQPDREHLPTCKIVSKVDLRAQHQKKLDIERRKAKGHGAGPTAKNLELNWAIAGGDLKHRLDKMKEFLTEGRRVEVMLGPKRRGRVATPEECTAVLNAVRAAAGDVKGAGESKDAEGSIGGIMTLWFEGRKIEKTEKAT